MVNEIKKNEIERRPLMQRVLSTALTGMLAMSACGMSMGTFAVEAFAAPYDGLLAENAATRLVANDVTASASVQDVSEFDRRGSQPDTVAAPEEIEGGEEANKTVPAVFATGDATVHCNGRAITGQQPVMVSAEKELTFTVTPCEGFAVEEVSFQMLSEGVLDVLEPTESAEDALYAVSADKVTEGMAIVVNTVAVPAEEAVPPSSQGSEASHNELVPGAPYDHTTLPVTLQTPSAKVKDVEKVYDGQPISVEANVAKSGATLQFYTEGMSGWSTENPRFTDVGAYTVLVKAVDPNSAEADVATAHVTVTPAPVVIEVHDAEKAFGSVDPAFEGAIEGLISGDEIGSVVYYRLNSGVEDAGFYADALSALVQHRNNNYTYTVKTGSFTIVGGVAASVQDPMDEPGASTGSSESSQLAPVNQKLVAELFAQGEGMQRLTEGVVEPIAALLGVANASPVTIDDDDTPLAAFDETEQGSPWTNMLVVFGALLVAVVGAVAVLLRLRRTGFIVDDLDEEGSCAKDFEEEDALPALDALYTR